MCTPLQRPWQGLDDGISVPARVPDNRLDSVDYGANAKDGHALKSARPAEAYRLQQIKADPRYVGDHPRRPPAARLPCGEGRLLCGETGEAPSSSAALS